MKWDWILKTGSVHPATCDLKSHVADHSQKTRQGQAPDTCPRHLSSGKADYNGFRGAPPMPMPRCGHTHMWCVHAPLPDIGQGQGASPKSVIISFYRGFSANFLFMLTLLFAGCATDLPVRHASVNDLMQEEGAARAITDISTHAAADTFNVRIKGYGGLTCTSVRQPSPPAIILHFPQTSLEMAMDQSSPMSDIGQRTMDNGQRTIQVPDSDVILMINASDLPENGQACRVDILLKKDVPYEVTSEETGVKISFAHPPSDVSPAHLEVSPPVRGQDVPQARDISQPPDLVESRRDAVRPPVRSYDAGAFEIESRYLAESWQNAVQSPIENVRDRPQVRSYDAGASEIHWNTLPPLEVWDPKRKAWVPEGRAASGEWRAASGERRPIAHRPSPIATQVQSVYATRLKEGLKVFVGANGAITNYKAFTIESPARIVFDIFNVKSPYKQEKRVPVDSEWVRQVRYYAYPDRLRVVLDTKREHLSAYAANPVENGLEIRMGRAASGGWQAASGAHRPSPIAARPSPIARLQSVYATRTDNGTIITIRGDGTMPLYESTTTEEPPRIFFHISHVMNPDEGEQSFPVDTQWVRQVRYQSLPPSPGEPERLQVIIDTHPAYLSAFSASPDKNGLIIRVGEGQAASGDGRAASGGPSPLALHPSSFSPHPSTVDLIVFVPEKAGKSSLILETSEPVTYAIEKKGDKKLELSLSSAKIPDYRYKQGPLITTHFESAVDQITPVRKPGMGKTAFLDIELRESVPYFVEQTTDKAGKHLTMVHFEASSIPPRSSPLNGEEARGEGQEASGERRAAAHHPSPSSQPYPAGQASGTQPYPSTQPPYPGGQALGMQPPYPAGQASGTQPYPNTQPPYPGGQASGTQPGAQPPYPAGQASGAQPYPGAQPPYTAGKASGAQPPYPAGQASVGSPPPYPSGGAAPYPASPMAQPEVPKKYTGEKIALDFFQTDIKNVFRILREVSGKNFAIDTDVSGKVTLTLEHPVPWDQVLDLILKMNRLGKTFEGDIIRIATVKTLQQEEKEREQRKEDARSRQEQKKKLDPLFTEYMAINYSKAKAEILPHIKQILTKERGTVSVDDRTNTIILTDTAEKIKKAKEIVEKLDRVTPQVLIEARIVEASTNFSKKIGTQWGAKGGIQKGDDNAGKGPQRSYNLLGGTYGYEMAMNLPVAATGSIGFNFMRLAGTPLTLNAKLMAMESVGEARIISAPKIVTLDNKKATIKQGLSYPYQTVDDGKVKKEFKEVDLLLEVTPHVTPDSRISMTINITKNDLGRVIGGEQSFDTKEAKTELLVNDGDTVVIGGIIKTSERTGNEGIPGLSKIPLLGWLFKSETNDEDKEELLIFITPRIIQLEQRHTQY